MCWPANNFVQAARAQLLGDYPALGVPQARPLSPGEVRHGSDGCNSLYTPLTAQHCMLFQAG